MSTADVEYDVTLNSKKFDKGQNDINNQFRKMKVSADSFGKSGTMALGTMAVGAGAAVVAFKAFSEVIDLVNVGVEKFNVQQKAEATLAQTLKATGYAAGLTAFEIKNMASELQGLTTYGDEAIIASSNLLLTFKNIGEDVFPEAQKAILDVSAAMGQDLKTSSVQVGKALNDPITGMTAMSRVGITFTDTQKELVKGFVEVNDIASAQSIILTELESQFGGVAEAQAKTFEGINKQLDNYIGDIQEKIGEGFTDEMTEPIQNLLDSLVDASPELASLAKSFGSIAGSLISVPVNALTGWIDLFGAYSAGSTSSIDNAQVKAIAQASDVLKENISSKFRTTGAGDIGTKMANRQTLKNTGGTANIQSQFIKASQGSREAMDFVIKNNLLPVYESLTKELGAYTGAVAEHRRVLNIESEQVAKEITTPTTPTTKAVSSILNNVDTESNPLFKSLEGGFNSRIMSLNGVGSSQVSEDEMFFSGFSAIAENALNEQSATIVSLNEDYFEQMLDAQIRFYQDSISIIGSSENTIIGMHEVFTSQDLVGALSGLSNTANGASGILGTLGLVGASGVAGIAGGLFSLGSTIAGFFGGDDDSGSTQDIEESAVSARANIVSSGVETVNLTVNFTNYSTYTNEEGLDELINEELVPRLKDTANGAFVNV